MLSLLLDLFSWSILSPSFLLLGSFSSRVNPVHLWNDISFWTSCPGHCCWCFTVTQSCLTLCNPMNCSRSGFPVLHHLPEFAQTHVRWVGDAIQPFHPLSPSSLFAFNLSQHQSLFQWVSSLHQVAKVFGASASASVLQKNIQDWFPLGWTGWISLQSKGLSRVFSSITVQRHKFFGAQLSLWPKSHPPDSSTHDY